MLSHDAVTTFGVSSSARGLTHGGRRMGINTTPPLASVGLSSPRSLLEVPKVVRPPEPCVVPCGVTDRALAGSYAVPEKLLRRKLGHAAFTLWHLLCARRDPRKGEVTLTAAEMGSRPRWERFPERTVKRALVRLRDAKLVRSKGRKWIGTEQRMVRVVRGAPTAHPGQVLLSVPLETAAWVQGAPGWGGPRKGSGGRREGAGRPKKKAAKYARPATPAELAAREEALTWGAAPASDGPPCSGSDGPSWGASPAPEATHENVRENAPSGESARRSEGGVNNQQVRPVTIQQVGPTSSLNILKPEFSSPDGEENKPARSPRRVGSASGGRDGKDPVSAPAPGAPRVKGPGAPRPSAFVDVTGALGVPPLPLVTLARVPEPPLLAPEDTAERHAFLLAAWYTGAVEAAYGKRCWIFARGPVVASKHFKALVAASKVLMAHNIPPAAWVAWSISVWREHKPNDFPPLAWVYGVKRIEERRGWFRGESTAFLAGGVRTPAAWRELRARHAEMLRALSREPSLTSESAREVIDCFLPEALLESLKERVRREARDEQTELRRQAYVGNWIWS